MPGTAACCRSTAQGRGLPAARECSATSSTISPRRLMITRRLPGLPAQPGLLREFHAFLADVVIAGEPEDLAHHFAAGVIAPVLVFVVNALDLQRGDALGGLGRNGSFQVDEVAAAGDLLLQRGRRHVQRGRQRLQLLRRRIDLVRPRPDRLDRRADRERLAEAIDDASAMRRAPRCRGCSASCPAPAGTRCRSAAGRASGPSSSTNSSEQHAEHERRAQARQGAAARSRVRESHRLTSSITSTAARAPAIACATARARSSRRAPASPTSIARSAAGRIRCRSCAPAPARARARRTACAPGGAT